jgi:hypothetical protein
MDFSDALRAVKDGKKAARAVWASGTRPWYGATLELVQVISANDGRYAMPVLMVSYPGEEILRPFSGANWDLLADDWEIVDEAGRIR